MTTPLRLVPPAASEDDLRAAMIAWADSAADLGHALAAGLRSGRNVDDVLHSALPLARASSAMLGKLLELLEAEGPQ